MTLDESKTPDDIFDEQHGLKIVADKQFTEVLEGVVINYIDTPDGDQFEIKSPLKGECGSDCSSGSCES
ncbi:MULTISPECIES: hypothetical protein [Dehalobacter]|jgi:iron-sulfur cluster assembly protein|uniref:Uncharacterized protein n=2 Tax=Dehalobacter restrictus TaxID=55583 RepID=A0A857DGE1_9FIRM|nr:MULTISPECIES: hypothetical protein [Dehalobacter]AFV03350.1 hypothetical protein DHBDCA_p2323 [Dehalobacter sp. DCA]AFV06337.1 hypothetical protein DCF50_p2334 [Dehalobacter sp. CF]AHF09398.1 hypothetical protein DEHRE_04320 [Dehalobacter restrictus DSM 9455]EQB21509.1 hypothetical protein UNSWDHB_1166 [Dehalobacter sp. UNSWDHB]MCG1025920.1 hypothetical protein [Dehalobacter sp.]